MLSASGVIHPIDQKVLRGRGKSRTTVGFVLAGPNGASQLTLGAEYASGPRTALYGYLSRISNASSGQYDFAINETGGAAGGAPKVIAPGLRHGF